MEGASFQTTFHLAPKRIAAKTAMKLTNQIFGRIIHSCDDQKIISLGLLALQPFRISCGIVAGQAERFIQSATMSKIKNEIGKRHGNLLVISKAKSRHGKASWNCICDCGKKIQCTGDDLRTGNTKSCGCLHTATVASLFYKHGHCLNGGHSSTWKSWQHAKARCSNPKDNAFRNYGGRGIRMCRRWLNSFSNFLADMGPKPQHMTLERKNNDGNYEPGNCKWASRKEQNNNTRRTRFLNFNGQRKTITQWTTETRLSRGLILWRLNHGWTKRAALTNFAP